MRKLLAALTAASILSACSGGSGSSPAVPAQPGKAPTASAVATIVIPWKAPAAHSRVPKFIPASTGSIDFTSMVAGQQVAYSSATLSSTSPNCTSGTSGLTCTVPFAVIAGTQQMTVTVYDAPTPSQGSPLATVTQTITAAPGTTNTFNFVLNGVPAIVYFGTTTFETVTSGNSASFSLPFAAETVDGDQITGPLDTAINTATDDSTHSISVTPGTIGSGTGTLNINVAPNMNTATTYVSYCSKQYFLNFCGSNFHGPMPIYMQVPSGTVYVANSGTGTIEAFAPGASGSAAPIRVVNAGQIMNPAKTFVRGGGGAPAGLSVDGSGTVRFTEPSTNSFVMLWAGVGNTSPTTLNFLSGAAQGPNTTINNPQGIAMDNTGRAWVSNTGANALLQLNLGNSAPVKNINGPLTTLASPGAMAADPTGNVFVVNNGNSILRFPNTATGNIAPSATVTSTALAGPAGLAYYNNNLYVTNAGNNSIAVFPATANGVTTPSAVITSAALSSPSGIALDATGNIYVANQANNTIVVFAPGASGASTPIRTIAGSLTGLNAPIGLGVRP